MYEEINVKKIIIVLFFLFASCTNTKDYINFISIEETVKDNKTVYFVTYDQISVYRYLFYTRQDNWIRSEKFYTKESANAFITYINNSSK